MGKDLREITWILLALSYILYIAAWHYKTLFRLKKNRVPLNANDYEKLRGFCGFFFTADPK